MITSDLVDRLTGSGLEEGIARALAARGRVISLPAGAHAFRPGDMPEAWIVVVEGSIRVSLTSETGREIVLYRVTPGEACVLTTSCVLSGGVQAAEATVETATVLAALPLAAFRELVAESAAFRDAVLGGYATRLTDLVMMIEDTVFHAFPARLARALLSRARGNGVEATHQELAAELGSAREVVSRALKQFERDRLVKVARGRIEILAPERLERLAAPAHQG
jgi:CRP/FNR family transcriptional regulator